MRFQGDVIISHRQKPNLTQPKSYTTISIFKSADCAELLMCLLPTKRKTGVRYKIHRNIAKVYSNFILEGKLTVSLINPPVDIIISHAEHEVLMKFIESIKIGHKGTNIKDLDLKLYSKSCCKKNIVERPKQKLRILSPSSYPHSSRFPQSLVKLIINTCNLSRLDSRILQLKQLKLLDVSENMLTCLPCLDSLKSLKEIILSKNNFEQFPSALLSDTLLSSLRLLDISYNSILYVNAKICEFQSMVKLKLNNNKLTQLPYNLHKLTTLQHFDISNNKLISLPITLLELKLITLSIGENDFMNKKGQKTVSNPSMRILSLQEMCGKFILLSKLSINKELIPTQLNDFINSHVQCACGSVCFHHDNIMYIETIMKKVARATVTSNYDLLGYDPVTLHCYKCSVECKTQHII